MAFLKPWPLTNYFSMYFPHSNLISMILGNALKIISWIMTNLISISHHRSEFSPSLWFLLSVRSPVLSDISCYQVYCRWWPSASMASSKPRSQGLRHMTRLALGTCGSTILWFHFFEEGRPFPLRKGQTHPAQENMEVTSSTDSWVTLVTSVIFLGLKF